MARIIPKTSQQEEKKPNQVEERKDEAYTKWKEWKSRDAQNTAERETRLEEKRRKEREWELYRECNNILEENKAIWLERGRKEKTERLESERKETMSATHNKNGQNTKKSDGNQAGKRKEKKEIKPEYSRRMEEKTRLEGKQRMKSNLWKQRREHDGRLVSIFKSLRNECEKENLLEHIPLEIGNDPESRRDGKEGVEEDPRLEDLKLT